MEHQFYLDRLSAYFDNELKNEEHVIIHEHVQSCEECQKRLKELEKLENLIASKSELSDNDYWEQSAQKIDAALDSQTSAEITKIKKRTSSSSLWWKLTGVAASLVLVAIFAFEQKDDKHELLMEDTNNYSIENKKDNNISAIVDSAQPEMSDELTVGRLEIKNDAPLKNKPLAKKVTPKSQTAPTPVQLNVESAEKIPEPTRKPEASPEIKKENLRVMEFSNGGVEVASVPAPAIKQTAQESKEKSINQSIDVLSGNDVDKKFMSEAFGEIYKETISVDKKSSSYSAVASSQKPQPVDSQIESIAELRPSSGKTAETEYWRRKAAEYIEQLNKQQNKKIQYMKRNNKSDKTATEVSLIIYPVYYRQLFKAYFKIAIVTPDSTEEKQAVQFLKKYADSLGFKSSSQALYFLEAYKNEKNRQKTEQE